MAQIPPSPDDEAARRAASLLSQGLIELARSMADQPSIVRTEIAAVRVSVESLTERIEGQTAEDRDQRRLLGDQLAVLAGSLDRLVTHLQGLSTLMAELLERLSAPARLGPEIAAPEASFQPGGEGVTVAFAGLPGFQSLMDIQKAFAGLPAVAGASVERYQEGDSRILLDLRAPITASALVQAIGDSTSLNAAVDEARLETRRLKVKIL